jgi:hypothetical protein
LTEWVDCPEKKIGFDSGIKLDLVKEEEDDED